MRAGRLLPLPNAGPDGIPRGHRREGRPIAENALGSPALTLAAGGPPPPLVLAAALLLWLPGSALASRLLRPPHYDALDWLLVGPAFSAAMLALATLWATVLGLPLGPVTAWALLALAACAALLPVLAGGRQPVGQHPAADARLALCACRHERLAGPAGRRWSARVTRHGALALGYLAVLALGLGARLWSTRDLVPALGADTYHHALIARLLVERGGVPDSYAPYAPIASFAYHFGFHSLVAWLHWWTGADLGALLPLAGHLVNAAIAASVAWWTRRQLGDDLVAWLAAWLVALLAVFPAYFANWGRFTQAAGLLLLPVAAALWADGLRASAAPGAERRRTARGPLAAAAVTTVGLFLAHYRVAAMLVPLLAVWVLISLVPGMAAGWQRPRGWAPSARVLRGGSLAGAATALLLLPWLVRLAGALALGLGEQPGAYGAGYYALERLGTAPEQPTNLLLAPLAALGVVQAWRRRSAGVLVLVGWASVQLALADPYWWPRAVALAGRVDLITVLATLWVPAAVAAACALGTGAHAAWARWPRAAPLAASALLAVGTLLGGWQLRALLIPDNTLLTEADLAAIAWVRANTPPDARFAVSAVLVPWAPDYAVGIDGGYWLPLLAGRPTTVLPMLYPAERGTSPRAVAEMVAVARALRDAPGAAETAALLRALGIGYVYHSGRPPAPPIEPALASPYYQVVYDRAGVRILAVRPEGALAPLPAATGSARTGREQGAQVATAGPVPSTPAEEVDAP